MRHQRAERTSGQPLDLQDFLCFAMYSANHAFNRVYQPLLQRLGLTYPQFIALILLWESDGQTVGELGRKLFLKSNTVTPMLKRLEALGYIERRRAAPDERLVRVHLTAAGRNLQREASEIVKRVRVATGLKDAQVESLLTEIGELREALDSYKSR